MSFPEQLKKARLNMDYTQQQVADLMGITKSTYCGYETGKRQPDVAKIKRLACILNTSGDILLETGFEPKTSFENVTNESDIDSDVKLLEKQYILLSASTTFFNSSYTKHSLFVSLPRCRQSTMPPHRFLPPPCTDANIKHLVYND